MEWLREDCAVIPDRMIFGDGGVSPASMVLYCSLQYFSKGSRLLKGVSVKEIAKSIGVSTATVSRCMNELERGQYVLRRKKQSRWFEVEFLPEPFMVRLEVLRAMPYVQYLLSPEWKARRLVEIERAGHRCELCNSPGPFHVHHRTYERRGDEAPGDLVVLCPPCHETFHEHRTLNGSPGPRN